MKSSEIIRTSADDAARGGRPGSSPMVRGGAPVREELIDEPPPVSLQRDPRWELIERIVQSDPFQKSARLCNLLQHLAVHTIANNRLKLTEQAIGRAVLGKAPDYTPAEDSSVRVYIRQLRLRLHEYYDGPGRDEEFIVSLPKGGYALAFQPRASAHERLVELASAQATSAAVEPRKALLRTLMYQLLVLSLAVGCAAGWYRALSVPRYKIPWPLAGVVQKDSSTIVVLADAGFVLRMLGNQEVPLDRYIRRTYLAALLPKNMGADEASVFHYIDTTRLTSVADARAVGALTALSGPYSNNLVVRTARDLNANDLSHGDLIFVGSQTSNPWVSVYQQGMNFQIFEDGPHGPRYVINRKPLPGEKSIYKPESLGTLASGDDYAIIASLPAKSGSGSVLIFEGVRMEGSEAAIALLRSTRERERLEKSLAAMNGGRPPLHFEALLHAQSVAGVSLSVDFTALRVLP